MKEINNIGIITSGGDSPGMNAAIRAVVRAGIFYKRKMFGIKHGYQGMIDGDIIPMTESSVANVIQMGGTILKTARCKEFRTLEGRKKAAKILKKHKIDGLVVIGGDGSFTGAKILYDEFKIPTIGIPGTIDNDINGTDYTIGYDTAINTVVDAVNKLRDTAESHDRIFFVEVMGRDSGLIAIRSGIAVGAESIFVPEFNHEIDDLIDLLKRGRKGKSSKIIIVAEGDKQGGVFKIRDIVAKKFPKLDMRVTILGHLQRGGSPTCMDRVRASRIGVAAIEHIIRGERNCMIGIIAEKIVLTPFEDAIKKGSASLDESLIKIVQILSK